MINSIPAFVPQFILIHRLIGPFEYQLHRIVVGGIFSHAGGRGIAFPGLGFGILVVFPEAFPQLHKSFVSFLKIIPHKKDYKLITADPVCFSDRIISSKARFGHEW